MLTQLTYRVPVVLKSIFKRASSKKLMITELLIQDHLKVEGMFLQLRLLNQLSERFPSRKKELHKRRQKVFDRLRADLEKHTAAEEAVFYPECEKQEDTRPLAMESYEEHREIKTLLKDMAHLSIDSEAFEAKLTLLIEDVTHHVREEEEKLFPRVRRHWTSAHLKKVAGQIRNHKKTTRRSTRAPKAA